MIHDFSESLTVDNLIERIDFGDDVEFAYKTRRFSLFDWWEDGPLAMEVTVPWADKGQVFADGKDLVYHYLIDSKPLSELLSEVKML